MTARVRTLVSFTRPHTIIGTVLAVLGLWVMALTWVRPGGAHVTALATALLAALATNVYIVGLNQLTDVEIDRINKPALPLAAGTMTMRQGRLLVTASAAVAVTFGALAGPFLLAAVVIGLLVGTAYSMPPLRFKRFHVLAAASITSVRALVVNLLVFAHFHVVMAGRPGWPAHVLALTAMTLGLTVAIAWFKDIPDAAGDARHRISTLVLRLGARRVVTIGVVLLAACYLAVITAGLRGLSGVHGPTLAAGHALLLGALLVAAHRLHLEAPASVKRFYLGIWLLFFAEYVTFPAAAVLAAG